MENRSIPVVVSNFFSFFFLNYFLTKFKDFAERLGDLGPVDYIQGLGRDFVRMMEQTTCGSGRIQHAPFTGVLMGFFTLLLAIYYR